jgi:hypothetical protein
MTWLNRLYLGTRLLPGVILLGGLLFGARVWQIQRNRRGADVSDWDIPKLVSHFHARGLPVRIVFTKKDGVTMSNAFLTTTDQGFDELNVLPRGKRYIDQWRGVVYCEIIKNRQQRTDASIGMEGYYLERDHFIFVGDPALLARIGTALREGG